MNFTGRFVSNLRFIIFCIAFAWFIWFMLNYEPAEPEPRTLESRKQLPQQTEVVPREEEEDPASEILSAQEQRAFAKDRVRRFGKY